MRVPAYSELFHNVREDMNKIPLPVAALACGVRLPFTFFLRKFLNELPFHLLQVSPILWENLLALRIMWHRVHARTPSLKELQAWFKLRSLHKMSESYYLYNTRGRMLKEYKGKN